MDDKWDHYLFLKNEALTTFMLNGFLPILKLHLQRFCKWIFWLWGEWTVWTPFSDIPNICLSIGQNRKNLGICLKKKKILSSLPHNDAKRKKDWEIMTAFKRTSFKKLCICVCIYVLVWICKWFNSLDYLSCISTNVASSLILAYLGLRVQPR